MAKLLTVRGPFIPFSAVHGYFANVGLFDLGFAWVEVGSITPKPQVQPISPSKRSTANVRNRQ